MKYKRIFISSKHAMQGGKPSQFNVPFNENISGVAAIAIEDFTVPNTLFNVIEGVNDTFRYDQGGVATAAITPGFYDPDTLLTELNAVLGGAGFTFTKDDDSRSYTASCTTISTLLDGSTVLDLLGFEVGQVANNLAIGAGGLRWSTGDNKTWNLRSPVKSIFVMGDSMGVGGTMSNDNPVVRHSPILTKVPVAISNGQVIHQDRSLQDHHFITVMQKDGAPQTIPSILKFRITDENGDPVPFSENTIVDFTLVLRIAQ